MKIKSILLLSFAFLTGNAGSAVFAGTGFPLDPYRILKTWNYDILKSQMGEGREIMGTFRNQKYIAGLGYPYQLLGMDGQLEFYFSKDSISRIQFHHDYPELKISTELSDRFIRDTLFRKEYNLNIRMQDSLRRDSVIRAISLILGEPVENAPAPPTEKNARHTAVWVNHGYSCLYKDFISYSEVVFSVSTVPMWAIGEFGIPSNSEVFLKTSGSTRKLSWTATLAGTPSDTNHLLYKDIYLILEFPGGKRYLEPMPNHSDNYLPSLIFEDCSGSGIPQAWIQIPTDPSGKVVRHYIYSIEHQEPNIIFNTDDEVPSRITAEKDKISIYFFTGGPLSTVATSPAAVAPGSIPTEPEGFSYLQTTLRNSDGSLNFQAGIGPLEILYTYRNGGWEPSGAKVANRQ